MKNNLMLNEANRQVDSTAVDFFISRRGPDAMYSREIATYLRESGFSVLSQDDDIPIGTNFVEKMHEFLKRCKGFIIVLTPEYDHSRYTILEFTSFIAAAAHAINNRRLIIFRVSECQPQGVLAGFVYCNLVNITNVSERKRIIIEAAKNAPPLGLNLLQHFLDLPSQSSIFDHIKNELLDLKTCILEGLQYRAASLEKQTIGISVDFKASVQDFLQEYSGLSGNGITFGGRVAEIDELNEWLLSNTASPYRLILAPAGRGKSAFLVHWLLGIIHRSDIDIVFFPVSIRFNTNTATAVLSALVSRLAHLYDRRVPDLLGIPPEVLREQVHQYLQLNSPAGKITLIIIDGLDEANDKECFRSLFPSNPASTVKVVMSARPYPDDETGAEWLSLLGMSNIVSFRRPGLAGVILLNRLTSSEIKKTIIDTLSHHIGRNDYELLTKELARLCNGEPFVLMLYLKQIIDDEIADINIILNNIKHIDSGLDAYFHYWWAHQQSLWNNHAIPIQAALNVLSVLAIAHGPMTIDDIQAVFGNEISAYSIKNSLFQLHRFIITTKFGKRFTLVHERFSEFVKNELMSQRDRQLYHDKIIRWGIAGIESLSTSKDQENREMPGYIVRHLGTHLQENNAELPQVVLLLSRVWANAWYHLEGNHSGFVIDLNRIFRRAATPFVHSEHSQVRREMFLVLTKIQLLRGSVISAAESLHPKLLNLLLTENIWDSSQVLSYINIIHDHKKKSFALKEISDTVDNSRIDQFLDLAFSLWDQKDIQTAIQSIAPRLTGNLLSKYIQSALGFLDIVGFAKAIKKLKGKLDTTLTQEVMYLLDNAMLKASENHEKCEILLAKLSLANTDDREYLLSQAIHFAKNIEDNEGIFGLGVMLRSYYLCDVAYEVGDPSKSKILYLEALQNLQQWDDQSFAALCFNSIANYFANNIFNEALEYAIQIDKISVNRNAVITLIGKIDLAGYTAHEDIIKPVIIKIFDSVGILKDYEYFFQTLPLRHKLNGELLEKFRDSIKQIEEVEWRIKCTLTLATCLSVEDQAKLADKLIRECLDLHHNSWKIEVMSEAAIYLNPEKRSAITKHILKLTQVINDDYNAKEHLAGIAVYLSDRELNLMTPSWIESAAMLLIEHGTGFYTSKFERKRQLLRKLFSIHKSISLSVLLKNAADRTKADVIDTLAAYIFKETRINDFAEIESTICDDIERFRAYYSALRIGKSEFIDLSVLKNLYLKICSDNKKFDRLYLELGEAVEESQAAFFAGCYMDISYSYQRIETVIRAIPAMKITRKYETFIKELGYALNEPGVSKEYIFYKAAAVFGYFTEPELTDLKNIAKDHLATNNYCKVLYQIISHIHNDLTREELLKDYLLIAQQFLKDDLSHIDKTTYNHGDHPYDLLDKFCRLELIPQWFVTGVMDIILQNNNWRAERILKSLAPKMDEIYIPGYLDMAVNMQAPSDRIEFIASVFPRLSGAGKKEMLDLQITWINSHYCGDSVITFLEMFDESVTIEVDQLINSVLWQLSRYPKSEEIRRFFQIIKKWQDNHFLTTKEFRKIVIMTIEKLGFNNRDNVLELLEGLAEHLNLIEDNLLPQVITQIKEITLDWP